MCKMRNDTDMESWIKAKKKKQGYHSYLCVTGIEDVSVTQLTEVVTVFVNFDFMTLFVMLDAGDEGKVLGDE